MDLIETRRDFEQLLRQVSSKKPRLNFRAEFDELARQLADPAVDAARKPILEARILQLCRSVEVSSGIQFWSASTAWFSVFVMILFFGCIVLYMANLNESISTVRATRPILVFTLIVAMLGFGGLLIIKSLFASEDDEHLDKRFRLAREIFLVYAGIFGTIIGFYFGAADEEDLDRPPAVAVEVNGRTMTAQISSGAPPFVAYVAREGPPLNLLMKGNERLLTLELQEETCPLEATVTVVDGRGRRASADIGPETIKNWAECAERRLPLFIEQPAPDANGQPPVAPAATPAT